MKAERLILSLIAIVIGLLVAGGAFYIYQITKQIPNSSAKPITIKTPATPTPNTNNYLIIDNPKNEEVVSKKTITVSGKTVPESTIIVSSESDDQVVKPTSGGTFTLTHTIGDGSNVVFITAVFPNGEEKTETRTVSYTTEEF